LVFDMIAWSLPAFIPALARNFWWFLAASMLLYVCATPARLRLPLRGQGGRESGERRVRRGLAVAWAGARRTDYTSSIRRQP
jgi:hypothetical protein